MNLFVLYLILAKAMLTAFSGPTSLPVVRDELVVHRHVLTDQQLNTAVVVGRTTPGPNGIYVVCVGYFVDGVPGAIAGWLALITPALLVIPILAFLGRRADQPAVRHVLQSVILAGVGLVLSTMIPMAQSSASTLVPAVIALGSFAVLAFTRVGTGWVVLAAALTMVAASWVVPV